MKTRYFSVITVGLIFVIFLASFKPVASAEAPIRSIPKSAAIVPSVIEKDGKQIEFNEKRDKMTVQSFFDVFWSDLYTTESEPESTVVFGMNQSDDSSQKIQVDQAKTTTLINSYLGVDTPILTVDTVKTENYMNDKINLTVPQYGIVTTYSPYIERVNVNYETQNIYGSYFQQSSQFQYDFMNGANLVNVKFNVEVMSVYFTIINITNFNGMADDWYAIEFREDPMAPIMLSWGIGGIVGDIPCIPEDRVEDNILNHGVNVTYFDGMAIFSMLNGELRFLVDFQSGQLDMHIREAYGVSWGNIWNYVGSGYADVKLRYAGTNYMSIHINPLYQDTAFVFDWDIHLIHIECGYDGAFLYSYTWGNLYLVYWIWECGENVIVYWEFKLVLEEWVIEWTIFWDVLLLRWDCWFWVYCCCWDLPFVMFQLPLIEIQPIVMINVIEELYNATVDHLNLTYELVDIYGHRVSGADVDIKIDSTIQTAEEIADGIYFASFTAPKQDNGWLITVNATVPQVALVDELTYYYDVDEETIVCDECEEYDECTECDECEECEEYSTTTQNTLIGTTIGGFSLAAVIGIFGRKSRLICPPQ